MSKQRVVFTRHIPGEAVTKLKRHGFDVEVLAQEHSSKRKEVLQAIKGADAVITMLTNRVDAAFFRAAGEQLKLVANYAVGFDNIDLDEARSREVVVTNTPGPNNGAVSEHVLALMLSVAKRIPEADRFVRSGKFRGWEPELFIGSELQGKTLGILGLGRIGTGVAYKAFHGFDMDILYTDLVQNKTFEKQFSAKRVSLATLLKKSDFVTLNVPLTPKTHHLVGAKEFGRMKKTAYLINTSRGPVVNESQLYTALKNNTIAGAALDVFEREPKVVRGLGKLDNVILTPHIGSSTKATREHMAEVVEKNVIAVLRGKQPVSKIA